MHPNPILKSAIEKGDIISARAVILSSFRKARNEQDYQFISWVDFAEQQFNGKNESFSHFQPRKVRRRIYATGKIQKISTI